MIVFSSLVFYLLYLPGAMKIDSLVILLLKYLPESLTYSDLALFRAPTGASWLTSLRWEIYWLVFSHIWPTIAHIHKTVSSALRSLLMQLLLRLIPQVLIQDSKFQTVTSIKSKYNAIICETGRPSTVPQWYETAHMACPQSFFPWS